MFATCLFCNNGLGANESLEYFPVGRRIAYDESKGRLWVVCRRCERWNLSPLETRFEAIEEAEKAFRATNMKVVSDHIGMAQLGDGLELVRIGPAERPELAAWRYGDQFGRRRRRYRWMNIGIIAGTLPYTATTIASIVGGTISPAFKTAVAGWTGPAAMLSAVSMFGFTGFLKYYTLNTSKIPRLTVRDEKGELLRLTTANAGAAKLFPANRNADWFLSVPSVTVQPASGLAKRLGNREMVLSENAPRNLTGAAALRALGILLPSANAVGGSKRNVQDAVNTLNNASDLQQILRHGGFPDPVREKYMDMSKYRFALGSFEPHFRLALEMALHESDERRAMEGELKELEQRWREADAIAKIADEMFLPESVSERVDVQSRKRSVN